MAQAMESTQPETLVAVHQVPTSKIPDYEAWLADSGRIELGFSGFMSREVIKPVAGGQDFYTLVVRFDSSDSLGQWLDSSDWNGLHARLQSLVENTDRFGTDERYLTPFWYRPDPQAVPAPTWKIWMSTVVALYPSIFIISLLLENVTLPFAAMLLLSNLLAVASVSWITGPIARRILKSWMTARQADHRITILGTLAVAGALVLLLGVFLQAPIT
jgi:antibiotic biosynthesis monooxygenase (ABM) superfamily enzyme